MPSAQRNSRSSMATPATSTIPTAASPKPNRLRGACSRTRLLYARSVCRWHRYSKSPEIERKRVEQRALNLSEIWRRNSLYGQRLFYRGDGRIVLAPRTEVVVLVLQYVLGVPYVQEHGRDAIRFREYKAVQRT